MYTIKPSTRYKRDRRKMRKRGCNMKLLDDVVETIAAGKKLAPKHRDHALVGNWRGFRECHVAPDWLLIYKIEADVLILVLQETGTHSDLLDI